MKRCVYGMKKRKPGRKRCLSETAVWARWCEAAKQPNACLSIRIPFGPETGKISFAMMRILTLHKYANFCLRMKTSRRNACWNNTISGSGQMLICRQASWKYACSMDRKSPSIKDSFVLRRRPQMFSDAAQQKESSSHKF